MHTTVLETFATTAVAQQSQLPAITLSVSMQCADKLGTGAYHYLSLSFARLLSQVWAHVVLLVVLPCAAIYSLELSLKARFLQNQAAAATTAAAAAAATGASRPHAALGRPFFEHTAGPGQQQVVSASPPEAAARSTGQAQQQDRSHQRDRGQALAEALTQIEPLRPASFMLPGAEAAVWRGIFLLGLMLGVAMGCWYVSELGILLVMRSGRQLVCDAEGWLRLV